MVREEFPSQRAFCKATGLSEDMLSHVLAGRKDLSLKALDSAMQRIGYRRHFVPAGPTRHPANKRPAVTAKERTG